MRYYPEPSLVPPEITAPEVEAVPVITAQRMVNLLDTLCSDLCRWPYEYKDPDVMWNEKCDNCEVAMFLNEVLERV